MVVTAGYDVIELSTPELNDVVHLEERYGRIGWTTIGIP